MSRVEHYARQLREAQWNETDEVPWGVFFDTPETGSTLLLEVAPRINVSAKDLATQIAALPALVDVARRWWVLLEAAGVGCTCGAENDPLFPETCIVCARCEVRLALEKAGVSP